MKEFDKWWDENDDNYNAMHCATQDGWRAALEYVENLFVQRGSFEVEEAINKELRSAAS